MRLFQRAVATAVAGLAFAAAGVVVAAPASASPEDGKGCVGSPSIPASYICVISVTPENVVPSVSTVNVPVTVPKVCYFVDCTEPTTVDVPVPNVTPRSGVVAVLWYQGTYYPIAVGTIDVLDLVADTIDLVNGVVDTAVGVATDLAEYGIAQVNYYRDLAEREAEAAVQQVRDILNGLPTPAEIIEAIRRYIDEQIMPTVDALVAEIQAVVQREVDKLMARINRLIEDLEECLRTCFAIADPGDILAK